MNPLRKAVNYTQAQENFHKEKAKVIDSLDTCGPDALLPFIAARDLRDAAKKTFMRLPVDTREALLYQICFVTEKVPVLGADLSGKCTRLTQWGNEAGASSVTSKGSGCRYNKTDVVHTLTFCPETCPSVKFIRSETWRKSREDGLIIIADYGNDEYTWVFTKNGKLQAQRGWLVCQDGETFHSVTSRDHAVRSLDKKIRIKRAEKKASRRERLVARLCKNTTATLADAKALGYCDPGIAAFQSRHGIGDTATLPQLMATGDPSAVRLALALARKI